MPFDTFGDSINVVNSYIDSYTDCRKKHDALIEFERKKQ